MRCLFIIFLFIFLPNIESYAQNQKDSQEIIIKFDEKHFKKWVKNLRKEIKKEGISEKTLDQAFDDVKFLHHVIESDRKQLEFTLTSQEYLNLVVSKSLKKRGKKQYLLHQKLVDKVAKNHGVQARFIVALWGIESRFGTVMGDVDIIDSLVTLTYDGRREKLFKKQLIDALKIVDKGYIDMEKMKGSWAGAMGQPQFMPSTFLQYAYDHQGNNEIDIWHDKADVFSSTANYLQKMGWNNKQTWGREVKITNVKKIKKLIGLKHKASLKKWSQLGIRKKDGSLLPNANLQASLLWLDDATQSAYLVYDNFRVTLKWNRSINFALAVGLLSDYIGGYK